MQGKTSPVSVTAWPLVVKAPSETTGHVTYQVTVRNSSSQPIDVKAGSLHLGGACQSLTETPAKFTLRPGQIENVKVTDPNGHATDVLATFTATAEHVHGLAAGAAVSSRLIVGHVKDKPSQCSKAISLQSSRPATVTPGHGISGLEITVAIMAAALVTMLVMLLRKTRRSLCCGLSR